MYTVNISKQIEKIIEINHHSSYLSSDESERAMKYSRLRTFNNNICVPISKKKLDEALTVFFVCVV